MRKNGINLVQLFMRACSMARGLFPQKLPAGRPEFDRFFGQITWAYSLPDGESYRHAVSTMIMNLKPTVAYKSAFFFACAIKKAQANQTAYAIIQEIRESEAKAHEEALKQSGEATPTTHGVSPGDGS